MGARCPDNRFGGIFSRIVKRVVDAAVEVKAQLEKDSSDICKKDALPRAWWKEGGGYDGSPSICRRESVIGGFCFSAVPLPGYPAHDCDAVKLIDRQEDHDDSPYLGVIGLSLPQQL